MNSSAPEQSAGATAHAPSVAADDPIWWLWGKAQRDPVAAGPDWHPLVCHMVDVMSVADAMLERMPPAALAVLTSPFGGLTPARPWLRFVVGLHDMGKATQGFQQKWPGILEEQARRGLPNRGKKEAYRHGISGTAIAAALLAGEELLGGRALAEGTARGLARAVASHHGEFARDEAVETCWVECLPSELRMGEWRAVHLRLARLLLDIAAAGDPLEPLSGALELQPGFVIALTGLTAVADWLGSNADVFRYQPLPVDIREYQAISSQRAIEVLQRVGWFATAPRLPRSFRELFTFEARSLQTKVESVVETLSKPSLLIIESTMGDGKTEAALLVAEALAPKAGQRGLYIGLPTQATANQMLGRVQSFLERTEPGRANLQLVHGDAILSDRFSELKLRSIHGDGANANVAAQQWFSQSKRSLLASHAVGTVDQGLMGVLQTRHGFVRLFGLAGKTVVLDEVHAYDTYTSELLDRLVAWLSVLGSTVVILSATLPKKRRAGLIRAFGAEVPVEEAAYPRITAASRGELAASVGTEPSRAPQHVFIEQRTDDLVGLARSVAQAVAAGGCVAWICNTVQRAQSSFEYLRQLRDEGVLEGDTDLCLLHSRFLRKDRQRLERRAEELYGPKGSARPFRGILVGTQVLEQSLDLDFDLMLTDLAPIDLVLQRAGRLHRHVRQRPAPHVSPTLWLVMPDLDHGCPNFASVAGVYEADVMSRTWWELQGTRAIDIPAELETWVERVYGDLGSTPADPELAARLAHAADETREKRRADWNKAQTNLLFPPEVATTEDPFGNVYTDLKEDERGDVHPDLRAQTRLAEPSSDVVCLWDTARGISLTEDGTQIVDLEAPASIATARAFIEHSLRLENRKLCQVQGVIREPAPWREQSTLRHKKVLLLGDEAARLGFRLDPELGLVSGQGSERQQTRTLPRGEDQ